MEQYYKILGLKENASLNDIKDSYRRKAKQFHPDINKSPDAEDRFIEINEAYTMLSRLKTGKIKAPPRQRTVSDLFREEIIAEKLKKERERARARAAYYAKKRFEEFKKSPEYKAAQSIRKVVITIFFIFSIFAFLAACIGIYTTGFFIETKDGEVFNIVGIMTFLLVLVMATGIGYQFYKVVLKK